MGWAWLNNLKMVWKVAIIVMQFTVGLGEFPLHRVRGDVVMSKADDAVFSI